MITDNTPHWLQEHCSRLLANDKELRNLNLNIRRLDHDMMNSLAEASLDNDEIQIVNLTSSVSKDPSALAPLFTRVLPHHTSLQVIHLSYNHLVDVTLLGDALQSNQSLLELHLDYNQIDANSAVALAQGLEHNNTLQVLNLNSNCIGNEGARALGRMLTTNTGLQSLLLSRNQITQAGAQGLLLGMTTNISLKGLTLDKNEYLTNTPLLHSILYLVQANGVGRALLRRPQLAPGLWALVLKHVTTNSSMMYFFLTSKPELMPLSRPR